MEWVMGTLLGTLQLFYPLLMMSAIALILGLVMRSWPWMLASAVLIYPDAWYLGGTPAFPWTIYVPLVPVFLAGWLFLSKRSRQAS